MTVITRLLTGLLTRSAWLLPADRADWLRALIAETTEAGAGRGRVTWLLGGVWLIAVEALRRRGVATVTFVAAAVIVLLIAWPGNGSDSAVAVNRIEIPVLLAVLALLPLLVRRRFGPVRAGVLARAMRVTGYLVVLALITASAVQARDGQKLGAYFHDGGRVNAMIALVLVGYVAVLLIVTSRRVELIRSTLPIVIATGTLTGAALFAEVALRVRGLPLTWWLFTALALPLLTGFAVTRRGARDTAPKSMTAAGQGILAAVCGTATAVLLLVALTTVAVALAPQRVPLQTPPPPANGGCETCEPVNVVIPPDLRHEYWVGLSITQATVGLNAALFFAPIFALLAGGVGAGLGAASARRRPSRLSPRTAGKPARR
ncbi:MAG: hypothetical protein ABSH51_07395 [Solirubrobacteraceae bacterium]|jgi:hypothetical protein